jgi:signal recognition particle subunit SEC65
MQLKLSKAVAIANPDATEIVEAVPIANPDATEIVEAVPIANPDATEIIEAVAIANPDATEIVEAVTRATGGMNPELKICVLQHSLNEIQAAINLLQVRSQTKQISNPSGWVVDCLRGRWWEKTNGFQNSNPTNVVSSPASTGSSPTPKDSPSAQTTRITEDYVDPHYMPLETHRTLCEQFQQLGKEAFAALGIQQQIYLQWMHRFPQQLKQILNKLSTT